VVFVRRKPNQQSVQGKRGDAIADRFLRLRRSLFNREAHLLQEPLDVLRKTLQVGVEIP